MTRQALFSSYLTEDPELRANMVTVAVAADLTVLLAQAGLSRAQLAERLGWSQDKVAQVLAGESPLTLETVFAVAQSLGYTFDVVLRKKEAPRVPQPWERTL